MATELSEGFSDRQPCQGIYKIRRFGDQLHLHHQGDEIHLVSGSQLKSTWLSDAIICMWLCYEGTSIVIKYILKYYKSKI
jgi:hypothetical protein